MTTNITPQYDKLEDLPSLKKGWVRLVHRCIYKDHADSIKKNGLVFNRKSAHLSPSQKGGSYPDITSQASVYDEVSFWKSMQHDDFSCYDNAKYADTKIVFDIPIDEFCLLETWGRRIKGTVDSKYIVGCVPNVNGANKRLQLSKEEIIKKAQQSQKNPPLSVLPNSVKDMIEELLLNCKSDRKEEWRAHIYENINQCKKNLLFDLQTSQNEKTIPLIIPQKHCR